VGISSGLVSMPAILQAHDSGLTPSIGLRAILIGVVTLVLGGVNNIWGGFAAGMFLGFCENAVSWFLPTQWRDTIVFAILGCTLLLRQQGLFNSEEQAG
jgi:branched-subunit amino acid ABC-type transport system permease component